MNIQKIYTKIQFLILLLVTLSSCDKKEVPTVIDISIKNPPNIVDYIEGKQKLNLEGLEMVLHYDNADEKTVEFNKFSDNNIICSPAHEELLTISAKNVEIKHKPSGSFINQPITVSEIRVAEILIENLPNKSKYYLGEAFDMEGLKIRLRYNNGEEEIVEKSEFESNSIKCIISNGAVLKDAKIKYTLIHSETGVEVELPIKFESVMDVDNNNYPLSKIGTQIWMAENLRASKLNDESFITHIETSEDSDIWGKTVSPAFDWIINEDYSKKSKLGAYYNYYTVETEELCPSGWHVPSLEEWETLINFLTNDGYQGIEAEALKSVEGWEPLSSDDTFNGSNAYGFDAIPGGVISSGGIIHQNGSKGDIFRYVGNIGNWWTSTKDNEGQAKFISFYGDTNYILIRSTKGGTNYELQSGINVRCIKD